MSDIVSALEIGAAVGVEAHARTARSRSGANAARRTAKAVPDEWKPHEKSLTAGQLALHIAQVPGSVARLVQQNPAQAPDIGRLMAQPTSVQEVLKALDDSTAAVRSELAKFDDWYQHRGQLSVYLRMLNIAVPSTWGPSADELPSFLRVTQTA